MEPAAEVFGDNYYMQLCNYIRCYKGTLPRVYVGEENTIDINGSFSQWDSDKITAVYTDYSGDTAKRCAKGFGELEYINNTGRNDFTCLKVCRDSENIYFYAETAEKITKPTDDNWMTLFIKLGNGKKGYNYAVNFEKPEKTGAVLSQSQEDGQWKKIDVVAMKIEYNKMMLAISRETLEIGNNLVDFQFKWADNYRKNEKGQVDIYSFYCDGDAAPYGRMNYVYSEKV